MTLRGLNIFSVESLNVVQTETALDVYAEVDIPNLILNAGKFYKIYKLTVFLINIIIVKVCEYSCLSLYAETTKRI